MDPRPLPPDLIERRKGISSSTIDLVEEVGAVGIEVDVVVVVGEDG